MHDDHNSRLALAAVVREGTYDAGARSLEVAQSAVGQRIKQVEEKVGSVLIVRSHLSIPAEIRVQRCHDTEQITFLHHELIGRMIPSYEGHVASCVNGTG